MRIIGRHLKEGGRILLAIENRLGMKYFAGCTEDKRGLARFGDAFIPMDEALAHASVDVSGRPFLVFNAEFPAERVGEYETELTEEFFRAFAFNAMITLHINVLYGKNTHHITEAVFKSAGRALRAAVKVEGDSILSTKGVL